MADLTSSTKDSLDPATSDNEFAPEHKLSLSIKPEGMTIVKKTKIPGMSSKMGGGAMKIGSIGSGSRKSTSAPKGAGAKGQTNKSNALKGA